MIEIAFYIVFIVVVVKIAYDYIHKNEIEKRESSKEKWEKEFPNVDYNTIVEFLNIYADCLMIADKIVEKIRPEDKAEYIYKKIYKGCELTPDSPEMGILFKSIKDKYNIDLNGVWQKDITFGKIYRELTKVA